MAERKGNITVQTADIFPIIKKWLYSEHDIFLRELISNASDAITKRATLGRTSNQEIPPGEIRVEVSPKEKTISIVDNGVGMTESEVEKYITQLAFSGAEEFVKKMKEKGLEAKDDIIGKFGLGFYSAFMVADKVVVDSLSTQEGARAVKWICSGDTEYTFQAGGRTQAGTTVTLHLNQDSEEFLSFYKVKGILERYCKFMTWPITLVDLDQQAAEQDKKEEDKTATARINEHEPLWKKDPTTLKDEDYKNFYRELFPFDQDPLFWLHLKVDHPFELKGVLYFPKLVPHKPLSEGNIGLYCKQVFVSDNIKNIIPEFLGLLKGAIDSPDIPLNVSRSALQGDPNVKKISNYIIKKVAEALKKLFNNDRARYEEVWGDIGLFVKYGVISDTKFDELMRSMVLFKNSDGKYMTLDEYSASVPEKYKEKLKDKIITFNQDQSDLALRRQLQEVGVQVLTMDSQIDPHFMQHVEIHKQGEKSLKFGSVDAEIENILVSGAVTEQDMKVKDLFKEFLQSNKKTEEAELEVEVKGLENARSVAYFKVDEHMRRFKQMSQAMGQGAFSMPIKKTLVVNPTHPLVQNALKMWEKGDQKELVGKICHHIQDLATLSGEGLTPEQKDQFVTRSQELVQELTSLAL